MGESILWLAFPMAMDDVVLHKEPFDFELATAMVNDSVTREAITKKQMRKFHKFVLTMTANIIKWSIFFSIWG